MKWPNLVEVDSELGAPSWTRPCDELFHHLELEELQSIMYSDVGVLELTSKYIRDRAPLTTGILQYMMKSFPGKGSKRTLGGGMTGCKGLKCQ